MLEKQTQNKGKIFLIPTVISENTEEEIIPLQVKKVVEQLDYFIVENVRTARRYISSLKLGKDIESLHFEILDKDTKSEAVEKMILPALQGRSIGIISEAGCPGIADPGALAVHFAHKYSLRVIPLVGPSSILLALMASGLSGQSFAFHGYLPIDKNRKIHAIKEIERNAKKFHQTQIFMETPYRNDKLFDELLANCVGETLLCIARDITGVDEFIQTKTITEWRKNKPELQKLPTIFLLYTYS